MSDFLKNLKDTWGKVTNPKTLAKGAAGVPLVSAVRSGNFKYVEVLKDKGYDINCYGVTGQTPFHEAISTGNIKMAQHLVKLGADPLLPLREPHIYKNPVHLAIHKDQPNVIGYLKAIGFDLNKVEQNGWTPLDHAISRNNSKMVKALIEAGADPLLSSPNYRNIAVNAVASQKTDIVRTLLKNPRAQRVFSSEFYKAGTIDPPLIMAASRRYHDITTLILSCGFNINQRDSQGRSPLHHAVINQDIDLIKDLLARGADINDIKDHTGVNPFQLLCLRSQSFEDGFVNEAFEILLDYGADVNLEITPENGSQGIYDNVLHFSVCNRLSDLAEKLIFAGANPDYKTRCGKQMHDLAVYGGDRKMKEVFLSARREKKQIPQAQRKKTDKGL